MRSAGQAHPTVLRLASSRGDAFPSSTIYDGAFTSSAEADAQTAGGSFNHVRLDQGPGIGVRSGQSHSRRIAHRLHAKFVMLVGTGCQLRQALE